MSADTSGSDVHASSQEIIFEVDDRNPPPIASSNVSHGRPLIAAKRPRTTARRCDFILMKRVAEQKCRAARVSERFVIYPMDLLTRDLYESLV